MTLSTALDDLRPARVVVVHAHPDDESLWTGVTIAHLVRSGAEVHVVTCTLGEEGEVIPPDLRHLEGDGSALAAHRREELRRATTALGVTSHVLGETDDRLSRWRDSGMAGTPAADHPDAFARGGADAAAALAEVLREVRPDTVLTYEEHGGYLHPDHVAVHRATRAALDLLAEEGSPRPRLLEVVVPRSWAVEDRSWLAEHVHRTDVRVPGPDEPYPPSVVPDETVTHVVVDEEAAAAQVAALREHPTQVTVHDGYYALSNDIAARLAGREAWVLVEGGGEGRRG